MVSAGCSSSMTYGYNATIPYRDNPKSNIASVQIAIALILGLSAFLIFCVLRVRYPKIYVGNLTDINQTYLHSQSRQSLPRLPRKSLFGWLPTLFKINEQQILEHAGLDAVVFLGFFKMCIRSLSVCACFAIVIILPMRYWFTGRVDQDYSQENDANVFKSHRHKAYKHFIWTYPVFTYLFTFIVTYFLFEQTKRIIRMRQTYLGKQNSVTDRTVKLSGIPPNLRDDEDLKRHIESLGIGEVDSITIVQEWGDLATLFKVRKRILEDVEVYWMKYFESIGMENISDMLSTEVLSNLGDPINLNSSASYHDQEPGSLPQLDQEEEEEADSNSTVSRTSLIDQVENRLQQDNIDTSLAHLPLLNDQLKFRPTIRTGLFGLLGPKVDAINYFTEQLEIVDSEITRARRREYPPSSTAFITMKSVAQAQVIAQAVLDPKVNHLITSLAPAPHDIIWENLYLTRRERNLRILLVTLFIGFLSIILVFPVTYLAQLLKLESIKRVWPSLGLFLEKNKLAETLVTTLLPTYLFTILNIIMPYFYIWITSKQGYTSHSDEELSSVSKNFFYIFVNLFLVFTTAGLASITDTAKIANQLAQSLIELSLFYVDLIILQGIGIFPYKLILLGNLLKFSFGSLFWCKTPRDYLKLYKPPVFNFGLQLPQPILILIITVIYSVVSTKILTAGLIYFVIGYFVYKYQLLYACVHPPHSTGKVWPLVFRRVILGLLLFQFTMVGTLALEKEYTYATFLTPLPLLTIACLWKFQKSYIPLSIFIALRSIEDNTENLNAQEIPQTLENPDEHYKTLDERRELNTKFEYPGLTDSLEGALIAIDGSAKLIIRNDGVAVRKSLLADRC